MNDLKRHVGVFILIMLSSIVAVEAQIPELSEKYRVAELLAPDSIQNHLQTLRRDAAGRGWTFQVGYTSMYHRKFPAEATSVHDDPVTGTVSFERWKDDDLPVYTHYDNIDTQPKVDLRELELITPIKDQLHCNAGWAFGLTAAFETAVLIRDRTSNSVDLSEQQLLDGVEGDPCNGRSIADGVTYLSGNVVLAQEVHYPYTGGKSPQADDFDDPVSGFLMYSHARESQRSYGRWDDHDQRITHLKKVLSFWGSLVVRIKVSPYFRYYTAGVFNDDRIEDEGGDHYVQIIGWDDAKNAWLIKNSWGYNWGEDGFGYVDYATLEIGSEAYSIDVRKRGDRQHTSAIDAALHANGHTYFFKGDKYVRFTGTTQDAGYPYLIADKWPDLPPAFQAGLDAAVYHPGKDKVYFFKGRQYVRLTLSSHAPPSVDSGYPRDLPGGWKGMPDHFANGIDAAIYTQGHLYMFRGNEYIRFTNTTMDSNYPRSLPGGWSLPAEWSSGIGAACYFSPWEKSYFFRGGDYLRLSKFATDRSFPKALPGGWKGLDMK